MQPDSSPASSHVIRTEAQLLDYLDRHGIPYLRIEHPPVFTCEQAERFRPELPGVSTKNLFLRDRRGRYFVVMTSCSRRLDLKLLGQQIGASKLHFGPEEELLELLGVTPGAVTVLGLVNDRQHKAALHIDSAIWDESHFLCHPLVNTATLLLARPDLERFFQACGHTLQLFSLPDNEPLPDISE